jgi:MAE_28990/MAE_18760-like HEPN
VNLEEIRAELESEQTWRQDEIRFFRNQPVSLSNSSQQMQFRRALVLMLYAHYEGFSKFAFLQYVKAVNGSGVMCEEATSAIIAGT